MSYTREVKLYVPERAAGVKGSPVGIEVKIIRERLASSPDQRKQSLTPIEVPGTAPTMLSTVTAN